MEFILKFLVAAVVSFITSYCLLQLGAYLIGLFKYRKVEEKVEKKTSPLVIMELTDPKVSKVVDGKVVWTHAPDFCIITDKRIEKGVCNYGDNPEVLTSVTINSVSFVTNSVYFTMITPANNGKEEETAYVFAKYKML